MPDKTLPSGSPLTRKKYTPAFKAECVCQVAAGARQTDVARAQGLSPALLDRWQRQALAEAVPSSAERDEIGCAPNSNAWSRSAISDWESAASAAFSRHAQRDGTRRLRAEGHVVGRYALRTWLRRRGLRALSTRPQCPRTTVADPAAVVAENLLLGQHAPTAPNQVWVGAITSPWSAGAGVIWSPGATCSRRVVGGHLYQQMPTERVLTALEQALTLHQPALALIIHADRSR